MKLEKIKLRDIVNEQLTNEELELLKGGYYTSGCTEGVCSGGVNLIDSYTNYCNNGDGVCKSGMA
jgi:natural product precursor